MSAEGRTPARLARLRDNVIDLDIQVEDRRLDLVEARRQLVAAVHARDAAAAQLDRALACAAHEADEDPS